MLTLPLADEVKEHTHHAKISVYPTIYKHYSVACITRITHSILSGIMSCALQHTVRTRFIRATCEQGLHK